MVLDRLGESIRGTLQKIAKAAFVDEKLINELVKDIQRALLQADVNVKLVLSLTQDIKRRALEEKTPAAITKKEHIVNIVYEELVKFLGGKGHKIEIRKKPYSILMAGLYASGKTTTSAKLAKFFQKRGHKVALVQTDTYRPAALEQLSQLGRQINVPVYGSSSEKNAVRIYSGIKAEADQAEVVIIDTAGRDALSEELIEEIEDIKKAVEPDESLLVISGDIGQAAQAQAEQFHKSLNITGIIVTKMEGTAKGGGALTACAATKAPIKFIGMGEKIDDLEEFSPENFVGRLLGMGDIEALLAKAKEAISDDEAQDLEQKLMKGKFTLVDLYTQLEAMKKMGPLSKVLEMIPGMSSMNLPKDMVSVQESKLKRWKILMDSMTREELEDPDVISTSRIERIAHGAGSTVQEVRELLKQYKQSKKLVKMLKGGNQKQLQQMMKKMGGQLPSDFRI